MSEIINVTIVLIILRVLDLLMFRFIQHARGGKGGNGNFLRSCRIDLNEPPAERHASPFCDMAGMGVGPSGGNGYEPPLPRAARKIRNGARRLRKEQECSA